MAEVCAVAVSTASGHYEVRIGRGLLDEVGSELRQRVGASRVAVVTDTVVEPLFAERVLGSLVSAGAQASTVVIPGGESSKTWEMAGVVLESLARHGLDRSDAIVALGGGVVGDLAGFCAATYMRGIAFVQVPTTLLAQVDSSVGGKTGVDLKAGKNLAGAFWQPVSVLADTGTLSSLDDEQWSCGLAEIAKAAILAGEPTLSRMEALTDGLLSREDAATSQAIESAVSFKATVVEADERESGIRECLNLGHTLGHALELLAGYEGVLHGVAVAEGIRFAAMLAERVLDVDPAWRARQEALLDALAIPRTGVPAAASVIEAMRSDKKARRGVVRFTLSTGPGQWEVCPVADDTLASALEMWES